MWPPLTLTAKTIEFIIKIKIETFVSYCVQCRAKRVMTDSKKITTKNGKAAMKDKCKKSGTTIILFVKDLK